MNNKMYKVFYIIGIVIFILVITAAETENENGGELIKRSKSQGATESGDENENGEVSITKSKSKRLKTFVVRGGGRLRKSKSAKRARKAADYIRNNSTAQKAANFAKETAKRAQNSKLGQKISKSKANEYVQNTKVVTKLKKLKSSKSGKEKKHEDTGDGPVETDEIQENTKTAENSPDE